jgi:hypothetical protein
MTVSTSGYDPRDGRPWPLKGETVYIRVRKYFGDESYFWQPVTSLGEGKFEFEFHPLSHSLSKYIWVDNLLDTVD